MPRGLDTSKLEAAAHREIEAGLAGCQIAVARDNEVVWTAGFGNVTPSTRFWIASATKPILSSALFHLIGEGALEIERPVAHYAPEFAKNGKDAVTVEQVMLMTCGFPNAPMASADGADPARRIAQLAKWTLDFEAGSQYAYHGMSAHWVLAELIERISGHRFCDYVEARVTQPLGFPRLLGIPLSQQAGIVQLEGGMNTPPEFDLPAKIEAGEPGGGAVMPAATLALFYQALLHNPGDLWDARVLDDGIRNVRCTLPDPLMNLPANRTLGAVVGAGFGTTWGASPTAFGWPGLGGQIGFAEPATGISFAFFQVGDPDQVSQFIRGIQMSNLALELGR